VAHTIITFLYIAFAVQNPRLDYSRNTWMLGLLLAGPVIIPVYWVIHVWLAPHVGRRDVDTHTSGVEMIGVPAAHGLA
jgi:hypothetical protein